MDDDFPLLINTFLDDSNKRLVDLKLAIAEDNSKEVREYCKLNEAAINLHIYT